MGAGEKATTTTTVGGRIKTENYFSFCSVWFEINFYCSGVAHFFYSSLNGEWEREKELREGCQMNRILFSFLFMASAPIILNVNEGIKFSFFSLFYFHIVFLFPVFLFFLLSTPPGIILFSPRCCMFFNIFASTSASTDKRKEKRKAAKEENEKMFSELLMSTEVGEWLFCALAGKYGFGEVLIFAVV